MSSQFQLTCSMALTFGTPMALALRELWRTPRGGGAGWREAPAPVPPVPRPLPDCLIPKLPQHQPDHIRELEPA